MPDFRVVPVGEEDVLTFDNGVKAFIKREMNAGEDERHRDFMLQAKAKAPGQAPEMEIHLGHLNLVEINLLRVVEANGTNIPVSLAFIASLDRQTFACLLEEIQKRNPPLAER